MRRGGAPKVILEGRNGERMGNATAVGNRVRGSGLTAMCLGLCLGSGLFLAGTARAQPGAPPQDPNVLNSLDSLKRVITRRILSDGEKKEIRSCDREKSQFLKQCRSSDTAHAQVDRLITDAKLRGADPNDPAVAALLERKFTYEKACDDRYSATPRGKQCLSGEGKRREALEKALKQDKQYQSLLKKADPQGGSGML
jgi:hypothetical protein